MTDPLRTWLIAALIHDPLPDLSVEHWPALIERAESEGVLAVLAHRLAEQPSHDLPDALFARIQDGAKLALMNQLPYQAELGRLLRVLNAADIPYLILKGAALGHWLYGSPTHRPVTDVDLWFADRESVERLDGILLPLGYQRAPSPGGLSNFEQAFDKDVNGMTVRLDAHWALFNSALLAGAVSFQEALGRARPITVQNQSAAGLSHVDALLNAIGHRALKYLSGQADTLKWLLDQHLLFKTLNDGQWQELLVRSREAGISDLVLDAIEQSHRQFKTQIPVDVLSGLAAQAGQETMQRGWFQSWSRYQWHEMRAVSPILSERARWLAQRLWPNPEAMRVRYGDDDPVWKFMIKRIGVGLKRLLP